MKSKCLVLSAVLAGVLFVNCTRHGPIFVNPSMLPAINSNKLYSEAEKCRQPIRTNTGLVIGIAADNSKVCTWRGIPYAKPPVGDLRWKAPQKPEPWKGILDAKYWGPHCEQKSDFLARVMNKNPAKHQSEDCLNLNIWRVQKKGELPVMVWFHGGGLGMGTANTPMYWGDRLSQAGDVIVVSVNYRLGRLGFLALPALKKENTNGSTGNYAILDQIEALEWIQNNIAAFGGDPDNVTIFGESGGSWSVCSLLVTSLAKGLFHKAIMQSGACDQFEDLETGFETGQAFAVKHKCPVDDLICLRQIPAEDIVENQPDPSFLKYTYGPHIDNYLFLETPLQAIEAGHHNPVSVVAGFNKDEMGMIAPMMASHITDLPIEQYLEGIEQLFDCKNSTAESIEKLYPLKNYGNLPKNAYAAMASDAGFICPTLRVAGALSDHNQNTWVYRFDYNGFRFGERYGAIHALEIPLVMRTLGRKPFHLFYSRSQRRKAEALSDEMSYRWLAFAKHGEPTNYPQQTTWDTFDKNDQKIHLFNNKKSSLGTDYRDRCSFWSAHPELTGTW